MSKALSYSEGTEEKASQMWKSMFEGSQPEAGNTLGDMSKPVNEVLSAGNSRESSRSHALRGIVSVCLSHGGCVDERAYPLPHATSAMRNGLVLLVSIFGWRL